MEGSIERGQGIKTTEHMSMCEAIMVMNKVSRGKDAFQESATGGRDGIIPMSVAAVEITMRNGGWSWESGASMATKPIGWEREKIEISVI